MLKSIFVLVAGASAGRFIGIAAMPLITRIYSPEKFGVMSVFTSAVLLALPLANFRYTVGIPLPRTTAGAVNLLILSSMLTMIFSFIILIFFIPIASVIELPGMVGVLFSPEWLMLLALGVCFSSLYEALTMLTTRRKLYKSVAGAQIMQSVSGESTKIVGGILYPESIILGVGYVISQFVAGVYLALKNAALITEKLSLVTKTRLVVMSRRYSGYAKFRVPAQFFLIYSIQAPVICSAILYDEDTVGQFGLAVMLIALPSILVGQAASRAYYAELASMKGRPRGVFDLTLSLMKKLAIFSCLIPLILMPLSDLLFSLIFGPSWALSGKIAAAFSIFIVFQLTSSPFLQIFNITSSQKVYLVLYIARAVCASGPFAYVYLLDINTDVVDLAWLYSMVMAAYYLVITLWILKESRKFDHMGKDNVIAENLH